MSYLSDTMRVEMSLPVHMMLAVLISGANCSDPGPAPRDTGDGYHLVNLDNWNQAWKRFNKRLSEDPKFVESYTIYQKTRKLLIEACGEALNGLYPKTKELSVLKRIERTHHEVIKPYLKADNPDPRKIGLIAFYLLQHLVETGTLIVPEESSFGQALEVMLPALSPWSGATDQEVADYDNLNRSAQKQVRKLLINLQTEGYYKHIPLPDYGDNQ